MHLEYTKKGFVIGDKVSIGLSSPDEGANALFGRITKFTGMLNRGEILDYEVVPGRDVPDALTEEEIVASQDRRYFVFYKKELSNVKDKKDGMRV